MISCSDDRSMRVWDLVKRRCAHVIEDAHEHFVTSLAVHPSIPVICTGSVDMKAHIWECR